MATNLKGFWPGAKVNQYYDDALIVVLQRYPEQCVLDLIDPVDGIAGECERLPKLAQIKKWLTAATDRLSGKVKAKGLGSEVPLAEFAKIGREDFFKEFQRRGLIYGKAKWPAGGWTTIAPHTHPNAWGDWKSYFERYGFPSWIMDRVEAGESAHHVYTVPDIDPRAFDPQAYA